MWVQSLVGRPPRYEHGNPLQYSCLENPMDRDAWQAAIHGVAESGLTEVTQHACILTSVLWWGHSTWPGYFSYKYHWIFFFLALCISPVPTHFQPGHIDFAGSSYSSNNVAFCLRQSQSITGNQEKSSLMHRLILLKMSLAFLNFL